MSGAMPIPSKPRRKEFKRVVVAFLCCVLTQCACLQAAEIPEDHAQFEEGEARLESLAGFRPGTPVNDRALLKFLEAEGRKLISTGATLTNWSEMLGPREATLRLPRVLKRKLSRTDLASRMEAAVAVVGVFYDCGKCARVHVATATGFFITGSGALVTCRHVLASRVTEGRGVAIMTRDGRVCRVSEVLASDALNDILVLQVEGRGFEPLPVTKELAPVGSAVSVMSHPAMHFYTFTEGAVSRAVTVQRPGGAVNFLVITADFAKGSSGAPVCNESGAVVAFVNNTESIYYSATREKQENLQMVIKNCATSMELLQLVGGQR